MKRFAVKITALTLFCIFPSFFSLAISNDFLLKKIITAYNLRPLPIKPFEKTNEFLLGQALFYDPILSGNRDVSCATCHLFRHGTSDALQFSIGVGGMGLGKNRKIQDGEIEHPRNSLDLWNRDNNSVKSLFWDGRVEMLDPKGRIFRSPLGDLLPTGMQNTLAVQALFPLVVPDEMLGEVGDHSSSKLPQIHANLPNELASKTAHLTGPERIRAVHTLLMERLLGLKTEELADWQIKYRRLFQAAFPKKPIKKTTIADLGNAIAHFEEVAFETRNTPWDYYLSGDNSAISDDAKYGAILFYGKGKCAACHSGPLFSDFEFHSLAVKQGGPGIAMSGEDLGRYHVTKVKKDKYKFRTPPLRNVTLTAPYFHDGVAKTLREVIDHHIDPLYLADKYDETGAHALNVDQINSVSYALERGGSLSEQEITAVLEFLQALEDPQLDMIEHIIPKSVPSGLQISKY